MWRLKGGVSKVSWTSLQSQVSDTVDEPSNHILSRCESTEGVRTELYQHDNTTLFGVQLQDSKSGGTP